ncbi:MAG: peptidoglycan DD-metalloendopeptidase family protein [Pseudomonadota bacterium]
MACARLTRLSLLFAFAVLGGCALDWQDEPVTPRVESRPAQISRDGRYTVRSGDTLYSIAVRHGINHRQLAAWNQLSNATLIYPGQVLRLRAPAGSGAARAAAPVVKPPATVQQVGNWRWPTRGAVATRFDLAAKVPQTGILITGQRGQPVVAAAAGEVVYSGSALKGYGKLVIIQHNRDFLSAYGHNAALLVKEGDTVRSGQKIATMGETAAQKPRLHFEIRQSGDPVDPLGLLPRR